MQMPLTQTTPARRSPTFLDPTGVPAEHRVLRAEFQDIAAEFAAHRRHQLAQQPRRDAAGNWGGHQLTCLSVNQPACSITRRASSTVRCP